jgi:hypothetical protein
MGRLLPKCSGAEDVECIALGGAERVVIGHNVTMAVPQSTALGRPIDLVNVKVPIFLLAARDAELVTPPQLFAPMYFPKAVPRVASLSELRTYNCKPCGVTVTEAEEPRERRDV